MKLSPEQVRNMATLREKLQAKAASLEEELEDTLLNIAALDVALARSSFTKASDYTADDTAQQDPVVSDLKQAKTSAPKPKPVRIQIGDDIIGSIRTYQDRIVVDLDDAINVTKQTPPFESFFVNRIIGGMRRKDEAEAKSGDLKDNEIISCDVETSGGRMRTITVSNYRTEERAQEISNTVRWVLNRMRQNAGR